MGRAPRALTLEAAIGVAGVNGGASGRAHGSVRSMGKDAPTLDALIELTMTLKAAREHETMQRRRGALVLEAAGVRQLLEFPFGSTRVVGGRRAPADIVLDDASVSAQHFELDVSGTEVVLRDLGSTNGTWVHGMRIEGVVLPLGTQFLAGRVPVVLERLTEIERPVSTSSSFGELVGESEPMRELFALLARVAPTSIDVLVLGETGTGKELVARALHAHSRRAKGPLVVLDCGSLPAELAESEINGHRKGAFTGATTDHAGVFEAAHGGTIFLDEIGELPLDLQPKLLRVLERREVRRVGETQPRPADVRVVAATHRDLRAMVADGRFREDLYFRLAGFAVELPPLRQRPDDIAHLATHFLARHDAPGGGAHSLTAAALDCLRQHAWPGNVRELRDVIKVAAQLAERTVIDAEDLHLGVGLRAARERTVAMTRAAGGEAAAGVGRERVPPLPLEQARLAWLHEYFVGLLAFTGGNVSEAARVAEVDRRQVQRWLARLGVKG